MKRLVVRPADHRQKGRRIVSVIAVFDIKGATQELYDATVDKLTDGRGLNSPADWPAPGLVSHAAGPTEDGWLVVDVWDSQASFEKFATVLLPILDEVGMPPTKPRVYPAVRVITGSS